MAFVNKSKRKCIEIIEVSDDVGPGQYFSHSLIKPILPSKAPFMKTASKLNKYTNDTPGPGEYNRDSLSDKYKKNTSKDNDKSHLRLSKDNNQTKSTFERIILHQKDKLLKYNEQYRRAKHQESCFYFPPLISKIQVFNHANSLKNKDTKKSNKAIVLRKKYSESNKVNKEYESETLAKGRVIRKHNIELSKSGNKGKTIDFVIENTNNEIESPKRLFNTGSEWSKLKAKQIKQQNSINKSTMNTTKNNIKLSLNTTSCIDVLTVSKSTFKLRKSKGSNSNNTLKESQSLFHDQRQESIKKFRQPRLIDNMFPGPGYYFDIDTWSSFNIKPTPQSNQSFGSKNERFFIKKESHEISPASYFVNERHYDNKRKQNKMPFSSSEKRFNNTITKHPGPGQYNQAKQLNVNSNSCKSLTNGLAIYFNSTEKRFNLIENRLRYEYDSPGPGSYIGTKAKNNELIDIGNWKGIISESNKTRTKQYNINTHSLDKPNKSIEVLFPSSSSTFSLNNPPVGLYNADLIYTIDYKIKKKMNGHSHEGFAFDSSEVKMVKPKKVDNEPGYYYNESNNVSKQIDPPFHHSGKRLMIKETKNKEVDPGDYLDSYFNWNKKTYNINYI